MLKTISITTVKLAIVILTFSSFLFVGAGAELLELEDEIGRFICCIYIAWVAVSGIATLNLFERLTND